MLNRASLVAEREGLKRKLAAVETLLGGDGPMAREETAGKRTVSAATKKKLSLAAKARWATRKKAKA